MNTLLFLMALLSALLGSAAFALSQRKHWQKVTGGTSSAGRVPRRVGWSLLAVSFLLTVLCEGASFGALSWPLLIGCTTLITAMLLTWTPQALRLLANWLTSKHS